MKKLSFILVFVITVIACYADEEIKYVSEIHTASRVRRNSGTIIFGDDGVIKYFKRDDEGGMQSKINCELYITKRDNQYFIEEKLFWGEIYIMEIDNTTNEILIREPDTKEICARCKIFDNTIEFTWNDYGTAFIFTISGDGIIGLGSEFLYTNGVWTDINFTDDDSTNKISKKNRTEYNIDTHGDFGYRNVVINSNVTPKTILQNAINISITFQWLNFYCLPFLTGRY